MIIPTGSLLTGSEVRPPLANVLDRAIELAESGLCHSVNHVRQTLIREGHENVGTELKGPSINARLVSLIRASAMSRGGQASIR